MTWCTIGKEGIFISISIVSMIVDGFYSVLECFVMDFTVHILYIG